jgi:hypothetical protein
MTENEVDIPNEKEPKGRLRDLTPEQLRDRAARLDKEAAELRSAIAGGDLTTVRNKVAWILHEYPHTRDSDVSLTLKYWEQYQPSIYNSGGMLPRDLFRLERFTHIARVRAKIQNEYNLFPASERVKNHRRKIEEEVREDVVEDKPGRRMIYVYADETGKNQEFTCVAAVWAMTGRSVFEITRAIWEWKKSSKFHGREIHFSDLKKGDVTSIAGYLDVIVAQKELLSFKGISIEKATTSRPIDEVVHRLHEFMVIRGAAHELGNGRISLPHEISLTVDAEHSLDDIACADIKNNIAAAFKLAYDGALQIEGVCVADSRKSDMLQLADIVAGAMNRRKNHKGERGFKDEIADMVIEKLSIQFKVGEIPQVDATTWLSI